MAAPYQDILPDVSPAFAKTGDGKRDARPRVPGRGGFTLVELIFVIAIISILVSITSSSLVSAKEKARQVDCMSNLRNIGVAIVTYRGDHGGSNPSWTSRLYPAYIDDLSVYVCRSDPMKGHGPVNDPKNREFTNTADNDKESTEARSEKDEDITKQNALVEANSYFYEFSQAPAPSSWKVPGVDNPTWGQFKEYELREGNGGKPHSSSRMPIVRCYHHSTRTKIDAYDRGGNVDGWDMPSKKITRSGMTLNVAYAGNVVIAPLWWQGAVHAGERSR